MTLVSIIIVNYNYGHFIHKAIDSALKQTYSNTEVIVVDDGSNDDSHSIIESYGNQIKKIFQENLGQSLAWSAGFKESQGDIICLLDSDDVFTPDKVERVVNLFQQHPLAGWVFHELQYIDADDKPLELKHDSSELSITTFLDLRQAFSKARFPYGPPPAPCLCFKRHLLEQLLLTMNSMWILGDNVLKFGAISLTPGIHSPSKLTLQRIHGCNAATKQGNVMRYGLANMKTAFYLRVAFPQTKPFTEKLFAASFARLLGIWGLQKTLDLYECRQYMSAYASPMLWLMHGPRILFIYTRTRWRQKNVSSTKLSSGSSNVGLNH